MEQPKRKSLSISANLPVLVFREGEAFIAYTPLLDLSTAGGTFEEAKSNFSEALQLFLKETDAMGTLPKVLTDMGWQLKDGNRYFSRSVFRDPGKVALDLTSAFYLELGRRIENFHELICVPLPRELFGSFRALLR